MKLKVFWVVILFAGISAFDKTQASEQDRQAVRDVLQGPQMQIPKRLLVQAPHPDDVMLAAGLIMRTLNSGGVVRLVGLTAGDANSPPAWNYLEHKGKYFASSGLREYLRRNPKDIDQTVLNHKRAINYAYARRTEDAAAIRWIGMTPEMTINLGYPDSYMWEIWKRGMRAYPPEQRDGTWVDINDEPVRSETTGLDRTEYQFAKHIGSEYKYENVIRDIAEEITAFKPDIIVATHPNDHHTDHAANYWYALDGLALAKSKDPALGSTKLFVAMDLHSTNYNLTNAHGRHMPIKLDWDRYFLHPTPGQVPAKVQWFNLSHKMHEIVAKTNLVYMYPSQMAWEHPGLDIDNYIAERGFQNGRTIKQNLRDPSYVLAQLKNKKSINSYMLGYVARNEMFGVVDPNYLHYRNGIPDQALIDEDDRFRKIINVLILQARGRKFLKNLRVDLFER